MRLDKLSELREAGVPWIVFQRKASPSPSNAWLSKIQVILITLCGIVVVVLYGPAPDVGPSSLFIILDLSDLVLGVV
jgi:hypothetical protein